jgi:uncharacterized protein (DUF849 family)
MQNKVLLTAAVTGVGNTTAKSKHVPVTPKEIGEAAIESAKAGATVAHVHARDPKTGGISHSIDHYREIIERIRESETDVIISITAGGGEDFIPDLANPAIGSDGTDMQTPAERHQPVGALLPEMCTLDCGSINFGDMVYMSPTDWLREQARLIDGDPMFQFCLEIPWGAEADAETIIYMKNRLPMPMVEQSAFQGGNVRVGLEDNLYLGKGVLARNEQLVDNAVMLLQIRGIEVMTPAEARIHYKLKKQETYGGTD